MGINMSNTGLIETANLLSKRHGNLADHGSNVDKEIEILKNNDLPHRPKVWKMGHTM